jgi:hypothetical protein
MHNWDSRYAERVKLLVEILPVLAGEKRFALKGGTAINLFEHDLPRLSVDIDLTWLLVGDFASDVRDISAALEQIGEQWDLRAGDAQRPEYVKLNPNQVVPTLVHGGAVVIESNVILEYTEDRWQQTPLRPADPAAARMRLWVRQLDDVHMATRDLSTWLLRSQWTKRRKVATIREAVARSGSGPVADARALLLRESPASGSSCGWYCLG